VHCGTIPTESQEQPISSLLRTRPGSPVISVSCGRVTRRWSAFLRYRIEADER
jgi:hypothetical protein